MQGTRHFRVHSVRANLGTVRAAPLTWIFRPRTPATRWAALAGLCASPAESHTAFSSCMGDVLGQPKKGRRRSTLSIIHPR